jgi:hypothetical protein
MRTVPLGKRSTNQDALDGHGGSRFQVHLPARSACEGFGSMGLRDLTDGSNAQPNAVVSNLTQ